MDNSVVSWRINQDKTNDHYGIKKSWISPVPKEWGISTKIKLCTALFELKNNTTNLIQSLTSCITVCWKRGTKSFQLEIKPRESNKHFLNRNMGLQIHQKTKTIDYFLLAYYIQWTTKYLITGFKKICRQFIMILSNVSWPLWYSSSDSHCQHVHWFNWNTFYCWTSTRANFLCFNDFSCSACTHVNRLAQHVTE